MNSRRVTWSIITTPPLILISVVGLVAMLIGWDRLDARCRAWILEIEKSRP
jgi:hypothetical protein